MAQHRDVLADDLVGRVAVHLLRGRVPAGDDPVERLRVDGVVGRVHDRREERRRRALGDVARDGRDAQHLAGVVQDRRHGQRDRDPAAVLPDAHRLVVLDPLAIADLLEDLVHLLGAIRMAQHRDVLPEDLLGGVAVHPLRRGVPARDDPVERLRVDRVVGRVHDRREERRGRPSHRAGPPALQRLRIGLAHAFVSPSVENLGGKAGILPIRRKHAQEAGGSRPVGGQRFSRSPSTQGPCRRTREPRCVTHGVEAREERPALLPVAADATVTLSPRQSQR